MLAGPRSPGRNYLRVRLPNNNPLSQFLKVIEKAKESCKTANNPVLDHFVDTHKSIPVPKGGERIIEDLLLTRYACYLIARNGDPRKGGGGGRAGGGSGIMAGRKRAVEIAKTNKPIQIDYFNNGRSHR